MHTLQQKLRAVQRQIAGCLEQQGVNRAVRRKLARADRLLFELAVEIEQSKPPPSRQWPALDWRFAVDLCTVLASLDSGFFVAAWGFLTSVWTAMK